MYFTMGHAGHQIKFEPLDECVFLMLLTAECTLQELRYTDRMLCLASLPLFVMGNHRNYTFLFQPLP